MEAISEVFQQMMKENPRLEQRMKDAQNSLGSRGIECATTPSDACPKKKCDGSGFLWYIDYQKKMYPDKVAEDIRKHRELYAVAHEANDQQEMNRINTTLVDLKKESEWWVKCECHEQKQKEQEIARKLDLSGMPEKFRKAKVHGFKVDVYTQQISRTDAALAKKMATNFIEDFKDIEPGKGLYFYSTIKGAGKTRLSCSIGNALMTVYGQAVVYMKAYDLFLQIRKTFSKGSETTEDEILKLYRTADVLIIDDIAVENPSDFAERVLYNILDYRMDNFKTTIITSNKTIEELADLYKLRDSKGQIVEDGDRGERIKSRINKMCYQVNMPEESVRDIEAQQENRAFEQILFK
ncbi:ATP-binding protein [Lysinibacillus fusiformis]|uniref:ATP-binding protein n=1 Tax=Lysinibacillus fusiformis TaxID=28031 RepID=UPI003D00380C